MTDTTLGSYVPSDDPSELERLRAFVQKVAETERYTWATVETLILEARALVGK